MLGVLAVLVAVGWWNRTALPRVLARTALARRDTETALRWLQLAVSLSPRDADARFLQARALRREGRFDDAQQQLELAREFGCPETLIERERILAAAQAGWLSVAEPKLPELLRAPQGDEREICEAFVIGYIKAHRIDLARQLMSLWEADFPSDPQPYFFRGMLFQDFQNWKPAIDAYRKAIERDPKHALATFAIADCLTAAKQVQAALPYYIQAEGISDDTPRAWCGQAHCYRVAGQRANALELLERGLAKYPKHQGLVLEFAQFQLEEGKFAESLALLRPMAEGHPRNWDIQYSYAVALRGTGRFDEAARILQTVEHARTQIRKARNLAEQLQPDDIAARFEIGTLHLHYGEPAEGLWWLNSVLDIDPDHQPTHAALAAYYNDHAEPTAQNQDLARYHRKLAASAADAEDGSRHDD